MPLLEFTVIGPPVSHQAKNKANLAAWKNTVLDAARTAWGANPPLSGKLKCTIINFHDGDRPPLDDDNMVKPIRDALNGCVYWDDRQITYSETVQLGIDSPVRIRRASPVLLAACSVGEQFVYIRLEHAPDFIQLPE